MASKEIPFEYFQHILHVKSPEDKRFTCAMIESLSKSIWGMEYIDQNLLKCMHKEVILPNIEKNKLENEELTHGQKKLMQILIFCAMWEKFNYTAPSFKLTEEIASQSQETKSLKDVMEEVHESFVPNKINTLFSQSSISELDNVLKEASKFRKMSPDGFDYSFLRFNTSITSPHDICILLYTLTRIESEQISALIDLLNFLRERQKTKYIVNPQKQDYTQTLRNQKRLKKIDKGFIIPYYASTLEPLEDFSILENFDLDNRYIYQEKTVKFVCESDKVFTQHPDKSNKACEDFFESSKIALDSIYLYKMRNQNTHYDVDNFVYTFLKPENTKKLLLLLIENFNRFEKLIANQGREWIEANRLKSMTKHKPFRIIPLVYMYNTIQKLIQFICLIISVRNKAKLDKNEMRSLQLNYIGEQQEKINILKGLLEKIDDKKLEIDISLSVKDMEEEAIEVTSVFFKLYGLTIESCHTLEAQKFVQAEHGTFMRHICSLQRIIESVLSVLFSSKQLHSSERVQTDLFMSNYHGESAYYLLYLSQFFLESFNLEN